VSVKDRGVGTREQVLNVSIACWYMGPVSLIACRRQLCDFLHCFYGCERERNWMGTRRSVKSFFFLGSITLSNSVGDSRKVGIRGLHEIRMVEGHTRTKRRKCMAYWSGFPCRVYIDSNHRDSRI
jgi:hypothetical protein